MTTIERHRPPREIREQTKVRKAWIEAKIAELTATGKYSVVRSVESGSYQHVSAKVAPAVTKPLQPQERGICQICEREVATPNGKIAHHGYRRTGYGWQTGSCYGTHYPTLQQSENRLLWFVDYLSNQQLSLTKRLGETPIDLYDRKLGKRVDATAPNWDQLVKRHRYELNNELESLKSAQKVAEYRLARRAKGEFANTDRTIMVEAS